MGSFCLNYVCVCVCVCACMRAYVTCLCVCGVCVWIYVCDHMGIDRCKTRGTRLPSFQLEGDSIGNIPLTFPVQKKKIVGI